LDYPQHEGLANRTAQNVEQLTIEFYSDNGTVTMKQRRLHISRTANTDDRNRSI